jgi:PEP-CTERM motif-containing protein
MKAFPLFAAAVLVLVITSTAPAVDQISDTFTLLQNGTPVFAPVSFLEADEQRTPPGTLIGITQPGLVDLTQSGNYTIVRDPDGSISDVFGVADFGAVGGIVVSFFSAAESGATIVPIEFQVPVGGMPTTLAEGNGGPFDATRYLSSEFRSQGYTLTFQSDSDLVPEPSSLTLLGLSGLGLIQFAYRARKPRRLR